MKITRRRLALSLAPAVAMAQDRPAQPPSEDPAQLLKNAKEQIRRNGEALAKITVPVAVEPAFQFKP